MTTLLSVRFLPFCSCSIFLSSLSCNCFSVLDDQHHYVFVIVVVSFSFLVMEGRPYYIAAVSVTLFREAGVLFQFFLPQLLIY